MKRREGVSPFGRPSVLAYGKLERSRDYEYAPYVMISAIVSKADDTPWKEEELFPVEKICYADGDGYGAYGPVTLYMKDGRTVTVDYEKTEGKLMI